MAAIIDMATIDRHIMTISTDGYTYDDGYN